MTGPAQRPADPEAAAGQWLATLGEQPAATTVADPTPPTGAELAERMGLLAVPAQDREPVAAGLPDPAADPARWEALVRCHQQLYAEPG
ncbi:acyltransferase domain-containing protein, partial [Streptomyces sp. SID5614]|uniref:acyltransferase domain-containing protein n=1 Tax=Streptomyces sp. SID5614 TaxID=2690306 RepID=UPI00141134E2|nr:hypothetical protein [Streptomyces sp. SID5614]